MTNSYNIEESKKVPIIMNWLGCEGLRFIQMLTDDKQEKCQKSTGLSEVLSKTFNLSTMKNIVATALLNEKGKGR